MVNLKTAFPFANNIEKALELLFLNVKIIQFFKSFVLDQYFFEATSNKDISDFIMQTQIQIRKSQCTQSEERMTIKCF